jgi:hypothetical protein
LIAEEFITYGAKTAPHKRAAQQLRSRDVRAIRYLLEQEVLPSQVSSSARSRIRV